MSDSELNFVDIFFIRVHYFLKSGHEAKIYQPSETGSQRKI